MAARRAVSSVVAIAGEAMESNRTIENKRAMAGVKDFSEASLCIWFHFETNECRHPASPTIC
jgi:hypothetical protein